MKNSTMNGSVKLIFINNTYYSRAIKVFLIALFWLVLWQIAYVFINQELILPSPYSTFKAFSEMIVTEEFYVNVLATMERVFSGMMLSFITGLTSALLAHICVPFREIQKFFVVFLKSTPVMAVIIFAILWLTSGNVPVFACFLMCYPDVYTNVLTGLDSMDDSILEMSKVYDIKKITKYRYIYLPSVKPYIISAVSLISGLSWKTVVAAEVLSSPQFSMGYNLLLAKIYLETDKLFAWIIAIVLLSLLFEKLIKRLLNHDSKGGLV